MAVSRRLTSDRVNFLYRSIFPLLKTFSNPIECSDASTARDSSNFWLSRMGLIFDCSDIHLIIDVDRSKSTLYEFEYSNLSTYFDKKDIFVSLFDCRPIYEHKPVRLIIYERGQRPQTPTLYSNRIRRKLGRSNYFGSDIFIEYDQGNPTTFKNNLRNALTLVRKIVDRRVLVLENLVSKSHAERSKYHSYRYEYNDVLTFLDASDFNSISRSLMRKLSKEKSIGEVRSAVKTNYRKTCRARGVAASYDFSGWNLRSQYVISEYNTILNTLVDDLSKVIRQPNSPAARYEYLRDFLSTRNLNPDNALYDDFSMLEEFDETRAKIDKSIIQRSTLFLHALKQSISLRNAKKVRLDG